MSKNQTIKTGNKIVITQERITEFDKLETRFKKLEKEYKAEKKDIVNILQSPYGIQQDGDFKIEIEATTKKLPSWKETSQCLFNITVNLPDKAKHFKAIFTEILRLENSKTPAKQAELISNINFNEIVSFEQFEIEIKAVIEPSVSYSPNVVRNI